MDLGTFKGAFDEKLTTFVDQKLEKLHRLYSDQKFDMLFGYLHTYIKEGKRFRPYLVYTLYKAYGGKDDEYILNLSLSFELLHLFALVHDDICDKGMRRHSADTYHIHLGKVLTNEHHGSSQALLLGDMLFFWAQELFHNLNTSKVAKEQFSTEIEEVIYGQMMDVYFSNVEDMYDPSFISLKDRLKSGRYSFMRPMCIGAACAGQENVSDIEILGDLMGEAFQLRDDLIDVLDDHGNKTSFSDLMEGNQTVIFAYAHTNATPQQQAKLEDARYKVLTQHEKQEIRDIYTATGAVAYTTQRNHDLLEKAKQKIADIAWTDTEYRGHLLEILTILSTW